MSRSIGARPEKKAHVHRRRFLAVIGGSFAAACSSRGRGPDGTVRAENPPATSETRETVVGSSPSPSPASVAPSPSPATPSPTATATAAAVGGLVCREAWGARDASGEFARHELRRITIHHSATPLTDNRRCPEQLRAHQRFHQEQGWPDIAYHLAVDRRGVVYELRPLWAPGDTFTDYDPAGHLLILAEGNFDQHDPSDEQLETVALVAAWGAGAFGLELGAIAGHRDVASTSCPGNRLYRYVADGSIAARARELLDGGVRLERWCGEAGHAVVTAIESDSPFPGGWPDEPAV